MLYISRCLGIKGAGMAGAKYGVVDTEDGTETLISWAQLAGLMQTPSSEPLEIKGVDCKWQTTTVDGETRRWAKVVRIGVYKGPDTLPRDKITTV